MTVQVIPGERVSVVALVGDHDIATSHEVRRALAEVNGAPLVVVDLTRCTFLDSTVLGVLVAASRRCADAGGRLIGINPSGVVAKALAITGIDELLQTTRDGVLDAALEEMAAGEAGT